jgi:predicted dienelactone hydrolase
MARTRETVNIIYMRLCLPILTFVYLCTGSAISLAQEIADSPELSQRGRWSVGVRTLDLTNPGQPDILHFDKATGKAPLYDRPLKIEIWYPAVIPAGKEERTTYEDAMPGTPAPGAPKTYHTAGKALRDAAPVKSEPFPLVIVSHGYPGSRTFLTYLTENVASKGYVVAAIDHTDSVFGRVESFSSTLLNRSADQLFTIEALATRSLDAGDFLNGALDASRVAVVGYSMGGYGALATAGAGYSKQSGSARTIPGGYFDAWTAGNPKFEERNRGNIKAVVAISPWGAQPPNNSWDDQGLAGIHMPSLFIVGDQDDVSGYEPGVKRAFQGAVNSERYMLVYENARHNVGGNPPPPEALGNFTTRAFFDEPVWRKDRIAAINQHFVTAFLDLYLKGDETRREYLNVPVKSNDGKWQNAPGAAGGSPFSTGVDKDGNRYWKGFQRRWAVGLEMYRYAAGQAAK